jgi:hypothetical protein
MFQAIAMNVFYAEEAKREEAQEAAQQQKTIASMAQVSEEKAANDTVDGEMVA